MNFKNIFTTAFFALCIYQNAFPERVSFNDAVSKGYIPNTLLVAAVLKAKNKILEKIENFDQITIPYQLIEQHFMPLARAIFSKEQPVFIADATTLENPLQYYYSGRLKNAKAVKTGITDPTWNGATTYVGSVTTIGSLTSEKAHKGNDIAFDISYNQELLRKIVPVDEKNALFLGYTLGTILYDTKPFINALPTLAPIISQLQRLLVSNN